MFFQSIPSFFFNDLDFNSQPQMQNSNVHVNMLIMLAFLVLLNFGINLFPIFKFADSILFPEIINLPIAI